MTPMYLLKDNKNNLIMASIDYAEDIVKVVHCKDCIYGIENGEFCGQKVYLCSALTNPNEFFGDFYCANGERRENE